MLELNVITAGAKRIFYALEAQPILIKEI